MSVILSDLFDAANALVVAGLVVVVVVVVVVVFTQSCGLVVMRPNSTLDRL